MIRWITAMLDVPAPDVDATFAFWTAATDTTLSGWRDDRFATFQPAAGDPALRIQRIDDGPAGVHLDLHVDDAPAAVARAVSLGAGLVADRGFMVMASPTGYPFCFVGVHEQVPYPVTGSTLDQVCLDIDDAGFDAEAEFWAALTGLRLRPSANRAEFVNLATPPDQPLNLLLQRRSTADGPTTAHLDVGCRDVAAQVSRHQGLGADVLAREPWWSVLRDPAGLEYCLIDRSPDSSGAAGWVEQE